MNAADVLTALRHSAGTSEAYLATLMRLFNAVLYNQDDFAMTDSEAMDTLRTLSMLMTDIKVLSEPEPEDEDADEDEDRYEDEDEVPDAANG